MKLKTILLTGSLVLLGACSESKYDLDQLVPEEYHKILYVNNSGKQALTLYDTEEDNKYTLSVVKSGSDPSLTANVNINVLTQAELDSKYSEPEGVNYKLIGEGCYTLDATLLDFSIADRYKMVNIFLKPQSVKATMETDPEAVWVLPLRVTSETDSINADKDELFLQIAGVITPALGFAQSSVEVKLLEYGSVSTFTEKVVFGLDTDNKWDLDCKFAVDKDYVTEYNLDNETFFRVLPEGTYTVPETMTLANGTTKAELGVIIKGEQLEPGDYMLPIKITEVSQFGISEEKSIYPLAIRIMGPQLSRAGWAGEANTEELTGEGASGKAGCALDGDLSTYWHSTWQSGNWVSFPFEIIVDTQKEYTFTQFALMQRQHDSYTDARSGKFYVSSDKENWMEVGSFFMEKILDKQVFAITPAKGRYFKVSIYESYRGTNASLSEIYAYGLE